MRHGSSSHFVSVLVLENEYKLGWLLIHQLSFSLLEKLMRGRLRGECSTYSQNRTTTCSMSLFDCRQKSGALQSWYNKAIFEGARLVHTL